MNLKRLAELLAVRDSSLAFATKAESSGINPWGAYSAAVHAHYVHEKVLAEHRELTAKSQTYRLFTTGWMRAWEEVASPEVKAALKRGCPT